MATDRPLPAVAAIVVTFMLAVAAVVGAKTQAKAEESRPGTTEAAPGSDVPAMGVSLNRIRRLLRETPPTQPSATSSLLRVQYHVEVVGKAPRIDIFKNSDIGRGTAVQYGGITHDEFLMLTAPPWRRR